MPYIVLEDFPVHQLCAIAAQHKASNTFTERREVVSFIGSSRSWAFVPDVYIPPADHY